ncbi:hypothetical protein NWI74_001775 [Salmonella enterica]|nr:hypothetical protein [Salmonella enterica]ECD2083556.1 hypothetical protein [Salmonella enterica subsp. enterica]EDQ3255306.1 hypothetical protein [Salmonella enterica subsp. enterica serovar Farmsen]EAW0948079.1 hypothetical protein [Salmonella enterica]EBA3097739.1 hypothetical protein [Salmonella enterica]
MIGVRKLRNLPAQAN